MHGPERLVEQRPEPVERVPRHLAQARLAGGRRRALGTEDVIRIIDGYIEGFRKAVDEGKVRFDSPADLDRLVRLKELMLGNADSRQEIEGGLTLDAIQEATTGCAPGSTG